MYYKQKKEMKVKFKSMDLLLYCSVFEAFFIKKQKKNLYGAG